MKSLVVMMVRLYQGWSVRRNPVCRFEPSCSQYMLEAVESHGVARGIRLGVWRVMRCRPGGGYGYDPVVEVEHCSESAGHRVALGSAMEK